MPAEKKSLFLDAYYTPSNHGTLDDGNVERYLKDGIGDLKLLDRYLSIKSIYRYENFRFKVYA